MPAASYVVEIKEARYLHSTEWLTKQDPYAVIWTTQSKNAKIRTKVSKDTGRSAKWEETFTISVLDDKVESFFIEVFNKNDLTFDRLIGRTKFACSDIGVAPAKVKNISINS